MLVEDAWRVYYSDIPLDAFAAPKALLVAFLDRFGITMRLGGKEGRLFLEQVVASIDANRLFEPRDPIQRGEEIIVNLMFKANLDGSADVAMAYAYRLTDYLAALRRHGDH